MKNLFKTILLAVSSVIIFVGCSTKNAESTSSESLFGGTAEYETQMFCYPDSTCRHLIDLCEVRYYVEDSIIYTSEKYHFITLGYSWDNDTTLAYTHMIFFDRRQEADSTGWYKLVIDKNNIPREPGTHISSIALRSYCGDKYDYKHLPHADAMLFNATKEIASARERNTLSPQLSKLYELIK